MNKGKKTRLWLVVLVGFFLYCGYIMIEQQKVLEARKAEMLAIQEKIAEEEKRTEELKKQQEMLNSDEYIEKTARERLGMVKEGEKIFIDVNK